MFQPTADFFLQKGFTFHTFKFLQYIQYFLQNTLNILISFNGKVNILISESK